MRPYVLVVRGKPALERLPAPDRNPLLEQRTVAEKPSSARARAGKITERTYWDDKPPPKHQYRFGRRVVAKPPSVVSSVSVQPSASLYVMWDGSDLLKVGISTNLPKRLLSIRSGSGRALEVYAAEAIDAQDPREAEAHAHALLAKYRVRGEWFRCHPEVALAALRQAAFAADNGS